MYEIIAKLLNCSIVTSPSPKRRGNNLAIEQFNNRKSSQGFTLIELLVVIAIIGILASIMILNIAGNIGKANLAKAKVFSKSIESDVASQVGRWRFEEGTGTIAKDSSSFSNDGTLLDGASITASCNNLGFGSCLTLGGTDEYVTIPDSPNLQLGKNMTISTWFYPLADVAGWVRLVGKGATAVRNYGLWRAADGDLLFQIYSATGSGTCQNNLGPGDILNAPVGRWSHFVGSYDGINMTVYINGDLGKTCPYNQTPYISSDPVTIGYAGFDTYFNGLIDEVSIYNQPFTVSQIKQLYAQALLRRQLSLR